MRVGFSGEEGELPRRGDVVLIVARGELAERAIAHLSVRFPGLVVLQEEAETTWEVIRRRTRLLGPVNAWGQVAASIAIRFVGRLSAARAKQLRADDPIKEPIRRARVISVGNVNSHRCRRALALLRPRVVAVYGTRIISSKTLAAVDAPFINYHAGINPKYRGQHPAYWALVQNDRHNAGVTVHLVDKGVDTGEVIYQVPVAFEKKDNIATYQMVQLATGMNLLAQAVYDALEGRLRTSTVQLPSRLWFPPTIWQYMWNGAVKGVW